jgi:hypothetical protein
MHTLLDGGVVEGGVVEGGVVGGAELEPPPPQATASAAIKSKTFRMRER